MKRLLASSIAVVALATSCGIAKDEVAATVNGREVSTSSVLALSKTAMIKQGLQSSGTGLVSQIPGTTGGAAQRLALTYYVVALVFEEDVASRGGKVTSADTSAGEQQVASQEKQGSTFGATERKLMVRLDAAQAAFVRLAKVDSAAVTDAAIKQYFDSHPEEFGVVTCLDGFALPEANRAGAQAKVDAGATAEDVIADSTLTAEPLQQGGGQVCVPKGQIQVPALSALIEDGAIGAWASTVVQGQAGDNVVVFVKPVTRAPASLNDASTVDQIKQTLQQQADTAAQGKIADEQRKLLARAKVEIDPQYGTWDPKGTSSLIAAPLSPKAPASATTIPAVTGLSGQ